MRSRTYHAGARRAREQRDLAKVATACAIPWRHPLAGRFAITIVRVGKGKLDGDNLERACKHVRDGIADALRIDDGDERLAWTCSQRPKSKTYSVEIEIRRLADE